MTTPEHPYALGYVYNEASRQQLLASACYTVADITDDRPLPDACSLAQFREYPFDQGQVGTCWANAGVQVAQILLTALGNQPFAISRRFTGYYGKQLENGGNPANGGNPTSALRAMTSEDGKGCCAEDVCPYVPDPSVLGRRPSPEAIADAGKRYIHQISDVELGDQAKRLIINGHATAIGHYWPSGWDSRIGKDGRATGIGPLARNIFGPLGHALAIIGFINDWDGHLWWQIENSHGAIYNPIPAAIASRIPGYRPAHADRTHDFWTRDDWLREVFGYGMKELVTAATAEGFVKRVLPFLQPEDLVEM